MACRRSWGAECSARHGLRWRPREDRQLPSEALGGGIGELGAAGTWGSSRELTPVASFSLWLGSGAVAEEGRDLGLRSTEKDAPRAQREWTGDSD